MTALGATTSKDATAALGPATDKEAMRASTLHLRGLISTLGSHGNNPQTKSMLSKHANKTESAQVKHGETTSVRTQPSPN